MNVSRKIVAVAAILIMTLAGGATWALAHGGDPGLVHACVSSGNGAVRVVEPSERCLKKETPLDWNIQGQPGPQGPAGVLGFYTRYNPGGPCEDGFNCVAIAVCDQGDAVTGGGFEHGGTSGQQGISVVQSRPTSDTIWQVILGNYSGEDIEFRAYARCADLTS